MASTDETGGGLSDNNGSALTALVTGGAKRVGRAIALELAAAGFDVVVHYHTSETEARQTAREIESMGRRGAVVRGDLADPGSWSGIIEQAVAAMDRLDVLVNNASVFLGELDDTLQAFDAEAWARIQRINLTAPAALCHHAEVFLRASGRGCVVNLCDIAVERPWPAHLAYCASKAGLAAVTKALARALAPDVRVNGVAPGVAVFPDEYDAKLRQRLVSRVPLAREGTPEEVAKLIRYLVTEGAYLTGQIIPIDGGRSLV